MIVQIQVAYDITVENIYYWPLLYTVHFSITYNSNQYRDKVLSNSMQTSPAIHTCRYAFIHSERHENTKWPQEGMGGSRI